RARGEGFSPTRTFPRGARDRRTVYFPGQAIRDWADLASAELMIVPSHYWVRNILPLESVDEENGVARTRYPGTYPLGRNGMRDRHAGWVENVLAVLDEPGEWMLDAREARLYYWPPEKDPPTDIAAPVLSELIRVEGHINYSGPVDEPVRGLKFQGLTFSEADRFCWHGRTGWGLQHDWERFDSPSAMVRLRGAEDCVVEDCHFVNSASSGLRLDLHCQGNRIVGNHLERLGGVGILMAGYGPGTKDVNRKNVIENNYIHDIGELFWGSPAIFAWQSGQNHIAHNHIHHVPYTAICATGRIHWQANDEGECARTIRWAEVDIDRNKPGRRLTWKQREPFLHSRGNIIERNNIHNVMWRCGDGNCIYVSGAGGGNIVRENYCHDSFGKYMNAGIRCDDDQHQTVIERNIIHRNRGFGEGIISKGENDIIGNVIADLRPHGRHRGYLVFPYGSPAGSIIRHNIFYSRQEEQIICHEGRARGDGPTPRLRDTEADRNVYFCTEDDQWGERHLETQRPLGIEQQSISADPRFAAPNMADFHFLAGSPAPALGIKEPIRIEMTGLRPRYQKRWIGRSIRTAIRPLGGTLRKPTTIHVSSVPEGAEIHYTLDGSKPTRHSTRYDGPFVLREPAVIRARAFADGGTDLVGAKATFSPPPPPITEDFEQAPVGSVAPKAETQIDRPPYTVLVSDATAASGNHSLRFVDGPGQEHAYNPHIFYRVKFTECTLRGRFSVYVDENTTLRYQWRDYQPSGYRQGPVVEIAGGKVRAGGRQLLSIPLERWVAFQVTSRIGKGTPNTFQLDVTLPDQDAPRRFHELQYADPMHEVDWLGFVSSGQKAAEFYIDDIHLRETNPE
ncbi:MAG: right-handed parallel beta-helix repeat-containing protein, partial [Pirellulaceae bacterium]